MIIVYEVILILEFKWKIMANVKKCTQEQDGKTPPKHHQLISKLLFVSNTLPSVENPGSHRSAMLTDLKRPNDTDSTNQGD